MELPSLQSFYADIEAARVANVPVELDSRSLLQSAASVSESTIRELAAAAEQNVANLDDRHQAAIGIHKQLGSMVPVLDGLSARAIASREFGVIIKRMLWYLCLVLLAAGIGLYCFNRYVVPEYGSVRRDMELYHGITDFNLDAFPYLIPMIVVVVVLLVINVVLLLTGKTNFLMGWFGGRKYVRLKVASGAARTLGLLASQDASLVEAAQNTATLYALDKVGRRELSNSLGEVADAETYQILSQYCSLKAVMIFERARTVVPVVVLTIVGGGVAVAYGFLVYGPLIGLIRDLVEAGLPS